MTKKLTTLACLAALAMGTAHVATVDAQSNTGSRQERREARRDNLRDTFTGWDRLAEQRVQSNGSGVALQVASSDRRYDRIRLQVNQRSLVVRDVVVTMTDGSTYRPDAALTFSASNTVHELDLPGDGANVARIELSVSDLPSGQSAQIEVWGR